MAKVTRRPGRWLGVGPFELELRSTKGGGRRVFFDPIGSISHVACVAWTNDEYALIEDRLYDLSVVLDEPERRWTSLAPECRVCRARRGGNFEFNIGTYQVGLTVWWRPLYFVGMWLNALLSYYGEWKYKRRQYVQA